MVIIVLCILFNDVKAGELTDLSDNGKLIKSKIGLI
jgi:hypothetical protein